MWDEGVTLKTYKVAEKEEKVYRLKKAPYGLKKRLKFGIAKLMSTFQEWIYEKSK